MKARSYSQHRQVLVLLGTVTGAIPAAAQERRPEAPLESQDAKPAEASAPSTSLVIHGVNDGLEVRVLSKDPRLASDGAQLACSQDCELKLRTGAYTLIASQGERLSTRGIELTDPLRLKVREPNAALSTLGTILGITGIAMASLGAFVTVASLGADNGGGGADSYGEDSSARMQVLLLGILGLAAGSGLGFGGFSLAAANRVPSMEVERLPPAGPSPGLARVGASFIGRF